MTIYILVNYKAKDVVNEDDREDLFTNDSMIVTNSIKQLWDIKPNITQDGIVALQEQKIQNDNCKVQLDLDH